MQPYALLHALYRFTCVINYCYQTVHLLQDPIIITIIQLLISSWIMLYHYSETVNPPVCFGPSQLRPPTFNSLTIQYINIISKSVIVIHTVLEVEAPYTTLFSAAKLSSWNIRKEICAVVNKQFSVPWSHRSTVGQPTISLFCKVYTRIITGPYHL